MSQYMIETNDLTKKYGEQSGVFGASLHIKPGRITGYSGETEPARRPSCGCFWG